LAARINPCPFKTAKNREFLGELSSHAISNSRTEGFSARCEAMPFQSSPEPRVFAASCEFVLLLQNGLRLRLCEGFGGRQEIEIADRALVAVAECEQLEPERGWGEIYLVAREQS
jgi:hypothetical protein